MPDILNLTLIEDDLTRKPLEPPGRMVWLQESYSEPLAFWSSLMEASGETALVPVKSHAFVRYDFFHDIAVRHQASPAPAFLRCDGQGEWQSLSYGDLRRLTDEKAAEWREMGLRAGMKLCILSPLSEAMLTVLLAALKIGLIVGLLPPGGRSFLRKRIEGMSPDFIWTEELYVPLIPDFRSLILSESRLSGKNPAIERSHAYRSGEPLAVCFDPSSKTPHVPVEVSCDAAYLCALRDGLIALGLKPGHRLAALDPDFLESQPALLLACLLCGATFVPVAREEVESRPEVLVQFPFRAVLLSTPVREILLRKPVDAAKTWESWFRDPGESNDLQTWNELIEAMNLKDVPCGNQKWSSSKGGGVLFSLKRKGTAHAEVLPSAGVPWILVDPADWKRTSLYDHGLLAIHPPGYEEGEPVVAGGMIARAGKGWMYVRPVLTGRMGRCYPTGEVLEVLARRGFGTACSIVELATFGGIVLARFVLLLFTGGKKVNEAGWVKEVNREIMRELGTEFLPDRVDVVRLHPRRTKDGGMDHVWCAGEYLSGGLSRRQRGEIYRCITELKDLLAVV